RDLCDAGTPGCRVLLKIVKIEEDAEAKRSITRTLAAELNRSVPQLLADNNYELLEMLVEIGLHDEAKTGVANYAAYWLLRGKLDERIALVKAEQAKSDNPKKDAERLAWLTRAKGDLTAAREWAQKSGNEELLDALLFEAGDWKELAKRGAE